MHLRIQVKNNKDKIKKENKLKRKNSVITFIILIEKLKILMDETYEKKWIS